MDPSGKKFPTLRKRLSSRIKEADSISHGRSGAVLPILTREVFIQVLVQRGVPLVQCPVEADWEIACLAYQWKCPVLTNDSDFYVFDLPGGCLPFPFFQWTNLNGKKTQRYISAQIYNTQNLCSLFGGMNRELLPLCAVLIGNDYGVPKEAEQFLNLIDVRAKGRGGGRGKGKASTTCIKGLLVWLSSFSNVAEALEEVSNLMDKEGRRDKQGQRGRFSSKLWKAMQDYRIETKSSLAHWFSGAKVAPKGKTSGLTELPECLSLAAAWGQLAPLVVDGLVTQKVVLIPQVENSKEPSSHYCSTPIRRAIYGLLLQNAQRGEQLARGAQVQGMGRESMDQAASGASVQAQSSQNIVIEYDRLALSFKKNEVEAQPPRTYIHLDGLNQAPVALRLGVLLEVLAVKLSTLAPVPVHLQLAVAVTGFWLREAKPTPSQHLVQALVLNMVYGEVSWNSQSGATHHQHAERSILFVLDQQRVRPKERRGLDVGAAHSFSQWQSCLWSALSLNQLLLKPLPQPHLPGLFSGTLVHGLHRFLKTGRAAESFLPRESLPGQMYSCLLDAVRDCSCKANPSSLTHGRKRRGRRGARRRDQGRQERGGDKARDVDELSNRFNLLCEEEDD